VLHMNPGRKHHFSKEVNQPFLLLSFARSAAWDNAVGMLRTKMMSLDVYFWALLLCLAAFVDFRHHQTPPCTLSHNVPKCTICLPDKHYHMWTVVAKRLSGADDHHQQWWVSIDAQWAAWYWMISTSSPKCSLLVSTSHPHKKGKVGWVASSHASRLNCYC